MDFKGVLKEGLSKVPKREVEKEEYEGTGTLNDLISRAFTTRNLLHFAHWNTKSYAAHEALGGLYDEIVGQIDEIVEVYQGKFGLLQGLRTQKATLPKDIVKHVEEEAKWLCENRESISCDVSAIENLLDELEAMYLKTIYKLKNLH
jgi:DNA-binding ferritin-like protein